MSLSCRQSNKDCLRDCLKKLTSCNLFPSKTLLLRVVQIVKSAQSLPTGKNKHCWIRGTEFVQITKSVFKTFNQKICEKRDALSLCTNVVVKEHVHNKCEVVCNRPPHLAQCGEAIDHF